MIETFRELLPSLLALWKVWLLIGLVGVARLAHWVWQQARLSRAGIHEIDKMTGPLFERRLAVLSRRLGYGVEHVGRRGDFGADLIITRDGQRTAVQAKRYRKSVGPRAVQEANAAPAVHRCTRAMVVTNNYFTKAAQQLAEANDVELWDRDRLVSALLRAG